MADIVDIKDIPKPNLKERTFKVSLTSLALAIEHHTLTDPNDKFVSEARSSLLRHNMRNVCSVSQYVHDMVMKELPIERAVNELLYA